MTDFFKDAKDLTEITKTNIVLEDKIPDKMPKYTSYSLFEPMDVDDDLFGFVKEARLREAYIQNGMFGFVSWKWINPFVEWIGNRKCLEVMAGRGWLSYALREKGVDVIATDNFSWHNGEIYSSWKNTVTSIEEIDAVSAVEKYASEVDIVIMCWAYMDNTAYETIKKLHEINPNALVVYIGASDYTANDNFFRHFERITNDKLFENAANHYEQWYSIRDQLMLGKYEE
ncbi:hypothetical protein [Bacillus thuringiensis]|uniref:SAM-dependent methyltransferase n=1 Tax=Bacillus thuringiensis TaxID=1428 RepID=A0A9X6ZUR9_BACTU|nr:hypothetical protein [Bacillus thuringiensis]PFJ42802.1 hypothetical protein COJ15_05520 [Bacillus thuringiensis]